MKNRVPMGHTNGSLAVITFIPDEEDPHEMRGIIHHVVGWAVNERQLPLPIVTNEPVQYFIDTPWYTFFMPETMVIDFPTKGEALKLEEALKYLHEDLIANSVESGKEVKPAYKH